MKKNQHGLTRRELEVAALLGMGYLRKEVAAIMGITTHTLCSHKQSIARKIGVHWPAEMAHWALGQGLVKWQPFGRAGLIDRAAARSIREWAQKVRPKNSTC